ncbi:MAG: hypothetical protein R2709_08755 [Marmoricola sp.]
MNQSDTRDALFGLFEEPLASLGLDLEAIELSKAGKRSVLKWPSTKTAESLSTMWPMRPRRSPSCSTPAT